MEPLSNWLKMLMGIQMVIFFLYGAFILTTIGIVAYLIVKRMKTRGKEDFEHRDN